jgi:hypothetical protein
MTKAGTEFMEPSIESIGAACEADTSLQAKPSLALGDRVRMSALGQARHPRSGDLQGLIVGRGSPSSWRIKFDERKCVQAIHRAYLERIARPDACSPRQFVVDEIPECSTSLA